MTDTAPKRPRLLTEAGFDPVVPRGWLPWTALAVVVMLIILFVTQLAGGLLGAGLGLIDFDAVDRGESDDWLAVLIIPFGLTALGVFAWTAFVERRSFASLGFALRRPFARFASGAALAVIMTGLVLGGSAIAGGARIESGATAFAEPAQLVWIALLLLGFVVQGSSEEIITRGWLMTTIAARLGGVAGPKIGLAVAVAISSAIFAALHLANPGALDHPLALVNLVLVGVMLAFYALAEGSLWGVCGWHAAWNWALATAYATPVSGQPFDIDPWVADFDAIGPEFISGGSFGPEGSILTTLVLGAGALYWGVRLSTRGLGARADGAYAAPEGR